MNRRTSAYALRINVPEGDLSQALAAAVDSLPEGLGVTDQHSVRDADPPYVSVSFRSADDEAAVLVATTTLARFHGYRVGMSVAERAQANEAASAGASLLTGHGIHRRTVTTWDAER